ncbi:chaperone NapD [Ferrovibrio sp.]|uniref:chaperone NapD n=1 Tax=Ferrovibrio sp. TaxID=1917215 RepID=UPI001B46388F|nr:chaperone NapD [Ferrovibrio sp.]MBP7065040.1 chaperone NapD [Ferrovibrio sp.]
MLPAESHISSLVVHVRPEHEAVLRHRIAQIPEAEIHSPAGAAKLVVVLETADQHGITQHLETIQAMQGVLAATLVYHQIEPATDLVVSDPQE